MKCGDWVQLVRLSGFRGTECNEGDWWSEEKGAEWSEVG